MKDTKLALSICIPTFNRLHYLEESLGTILPQAQRLGVEVCVSDNHSTDGTTTYLTAMAERFSCLHCYFQKENIGLEKNMISAITYGSGAYILPIGDDEVLPDGALDLLLKEIVENVDVVILDGWHTDAKLLPQRRHLSDTLRGIEFHEPSGAFVKLWDKMPPGSFIAARELFLPDHYNRYMGTSHAYTGAVWDALADKFQRTGVCKVTCMSTPTVLLRGGEKSWRIDAANIMLYEIPMWFNLVMRNEVYQSVVPPILNNYLQSQTKLIPLLSYRSTGRLNKELAATLGSIYSQRQIKVINKVAAAPAKPLEFVLNGYFKIKATIKRLSLRW